MRILLLGDLEGKFPTKLKNFCRKNNIEAIFSPGDFSSSLTKMIFSNWDLLKEWTPEKRKRFDEVYGFNRANKEILRSYRDGIKILKKINSLGIPVYLVLGNQDYIGKTRIGRGVKKKEFVKPGSFLPLIKRLKNLIYVHNNPRKIEKKYTIIGKSAGLKVNEKFFRGKKNLIFLTHLPARGTRFAIVRNKFSPRNGEDVGSQEIRRLIKKYKPIIHICGHMHEHIGKTNVGKTISICAGFGHEDKAMILNLCEKITTHPVRIK